MSLTTIAILTCAVLLVGYLVVALLYPEKL